LGELNTKCFGVHSFVLRNKSIDTIEKSEAIAVGGEDFLNDLNGRVYNNYTIVVATSRQREDLRKTLKKQEILTVAEIKGLERETVILYELFRWVIVGILEISRNRHTIHYIN
jgi:hypothetical protein